MAQKIILIDDINGEDRAVETVRFGIDGKFYQIDLNADNAERLRGTLKEFIDAGRREEFDGTPVRGQRVTQLPTARPKGRGSNRKGIERPARAWAKAQGMKVSPNGRLAQSVLDSYLMAQQGKQEA